MDIVIFAAGLGARLRPLTLTTPKPLLPLHGKPLLEWHLRKIDFVQHRVFINVAWLGRQIEEYVQRHFPQVHCLYEGEHPLGVAAGLLNLVDYYQLNEGVVLINADTFSDINLADVTVDLVQAHAHLLMVPPPLDHTGDFYLRRGLVHLVPHRSDEEKLAYSGYARLTPQFIQQLRQSYTGDDHFVQQLKRCIASKRVSGKCYAGAWFDIGTPERYRQAQAYCLKR